MLRRPPGRREGANRRVSFVHTVTPDLHMTGTQLALELGRVHAFREDNGLTGILRHENERPKDAIARRGRNSEAWSRQPLSGTANHRSNDRNVLRGYRIAPHSRRAAVGRGRRIHRPARARCSRRRGASREHGGVRARQPLQVHDPAALHGGVGHAASRPEHAAQDRMREAHQPQRSKRHRRDLVDRQLHRLVRQQRGLHVADHEADLPGAPLPRSQGRQEEPRDLDARRRPG